MKTQVIGHCQCCGRVQAVRLTGHSGNQQQCMAHHGYQVRNGYFSGVCQGHRYAPIELDKAIALQVIATVRNDVVRLRQHAADLEAGLAFPEQAFSGRYENSRQIMVAYTDAPSWHQKEALEHAIWFASQRARQGAAFADGHEALVQAVYQQPMQIVPVAGVTMQKVAA